MNREFENKGPGQEEEAENVLNKKELHQRTERAATDIKVYHVGELEDQIGTIEAFLREDRKEEAYMALKEVEQGLEALHKEKMRHPHESKKETLRHVVGYEIAHLRRKRRMSREDFVQKLQHLYDEGDIAQIERGERAVTTDELEEITKVLDADLEIELKAHYKYMQ